MRHAPSSALPAAALAAVFALSGCAPRESPGSADFPASFRKGDAYEFPGGYKVRLADFEGEDVVVRERTAGAYVRLMGAAGAVADGRGRWRTHSADEKGGITVTPISYGGFEFEGARLGLDGALEEERAYMRNSYGWKTPDDVAATVTAVLRAADADLDRVVTPREILAFARSTFPGAAR